MKLITLFHATVLASAASSAGTTPQQDPLLDTTHSPTQTYNDKTSQARAMLKVSSQGTATGMPEIANIALRLSITSNKSKEASIEDLKTSASQLEVLLEKQQAENLIESHARLSTKLSNSVDEPYYRRKDTESKQPEFAASTTYHVRGYVVPEDVTQLQSVITQLSSLPHVKFQGGVEWELTPATRSELRVQAKREALKECLELGQESAKMLGFEGAGLLEVEEQHAWVREKDGMRVGYFATYSGEEEIDVEPREMVAQVSLGCRFGAS